MSSLDVTSLFTNIPLIETTDIIYNELFKDRELINGMDKLVFCELLTLAMDETCFVFDGKLFKQCDGVSMGSPLVQRMLMVSFRTMRGNGSMNILRISNRSSIDDTWMTSLCYAVIVIIIRNSWSI